MTNKQARTIINTLRSRNHWITFEIMNVLDEEQIIEALDKAISALDKQVPKKPIKHGHIVSGNCPCCGDIQTADHKYCSNCGQAIEWDVEVR